MKYITLKLTENQLSYLISTLEFDEINKAIGNDARVVAFHKRLLTTLIKTLNQG